MLKGEEKNKFKEKKFCLTKDVIEKFRELKRFFTTASILYYYNLVWRIVVKSDASSFAISVIILWLLKTTGQ